MRYRLIVVLIVISGFCFGQEPVTIKVGESQDLNLLDTLTLKPFCISYYPSIGYDSFRLNGAGFLVSSIDININGVSARLDLQSSYKFSLAEKSERNDAVSVAVLYNWRSEIGSDLSLDYGVGLESNFLVNEGEEKKNVFYGIMAGLGLAKVSRARLSAHYKYNVVNYNNDLNGSSVLIKLSYLLFNTCR